MDEFSSPLGRFGTMARLFSLIDQLPRDQQLILLKQLLGERITQHLYKLVLEMPEDRRQQLFEQLLESPSEPDAVTTVNLDEDDAPMRQISRKECRLRAVCVFDANTFDGTITDISVVGMFIKTERSLPMGKPIRVSCRLPGQERPLILSGEIIRSEPTGIGIRLNALRADQERAIRGFIDNRNPRASSRRL